MARLGSKRSVDEEVEEYEVEVVNDGLESSRNSRLAILRPRLHSGRDGEEGFIHGHIIHPDNRYVHVINSLSSSSALHAGPLHVAEN
jgi:hypothetical protein